MSDHAFAEFLKQVDLDQNQNDLNHLIGNEIPSQEVSYSSEWVKIAYERKSLPLLKALLETFGLHVRNADKENYHLMNTLVSLAWKEAIDEVLTQDPSLINVGLIKSDDRSRIFSLIEFALKVQASEEIINCLLAYKPILGLTDSNGQNVFHNLWRYDSKNLSTDLIKSLIDAADYSELTAKTNSGYTPYQNFESGPITFQKLLREKFTTLQEEDYKRILSKEGEERVKELEYHLSANFPTMEPEEICLALDQNGC
jgi:hypothetical protein